MAGRGEFKASGFGSRLKVLREAAGVSQEQLAERASCTTFTVSRLEHGCFRNRTGPLSSPSPTPSASTAPRSPASATEPPPVADAPPAPVEARQGEEGAEEEVRRRRSRFRREPLPEAEGPAWSTMPAPRRSSANLRRRHLSESQRAMIAARIANMSEGRPTKETLPNGRVSQAAAASLLNVGERTVARAVTVQHQGVPELLEAVEADIIAVSTAAEVATLPQVGSASLSWKGPAAPVPPAFPEVVGSRSRHGRRGTSSRSRRRLFGPGAGAGPTRRRTAGRYAGGGPRRGVRPGPARRPVPTASAVCAWCICTSPVRPPVGAWPTAEAAAQCCRSDAASGKPDAAAFLQCRHSRFARVLLFAEQSRLGQGLGTVR